MPSTASLPLNTNSEYINTTDYTKLAFRLKNLKSVLDDMAEKQVASRKLRYAEIDIEAERDAGRIQPDELYVPQHIIDTNIRREQSSYVQYVTQSPRAVILTDQEDDGMDLSLLEKDLTKKLRFEGWQLGTYSNIDGFQANGYGIMESVQDQNNPGHIGREMVQYSDFGFISDTKDLQAAEMTARTYYYTKTQLLALSDPTDEKIKPEDLWNREQVDKVSGTDTNVSSTNPDYSDNITNAQDKSLYKIHKIMFRIRGVVHVGWTCIDVCDDWLRVPRKLYVGRRQLIQENPVMGPVKQLIGLPPKSIEQYETEYPYFLYPYLISENNTISHLKGRVYLDQDTQEAVSSLLSSTVTQARRAAGMYFSKETADPNDDVLMDKNVFLRTGCLINSKVQGFKIDAPNPGIFSAIQMLVSNNLAETSQINFAESNNQKDSRKTATAIKASVQEKQELSTVQVVLFSIALTQQYTYECDIIKSRVLAGLIKVNKSVRPLYDRTWTVKPSGDVDVIEKQKIIAAMMQVWPVIATTAAAPMFLSDLLEKMFPDNAPKYIQAMQQALQQQQSQQGQQQQAMMQMMQVMGQGIIDLSKHKEMFSETGVIHAYPVIQHTAAQLEQMQKQLTNGVAKS